MTFFPDKTDVQARTWAKTLKESLARVRLGKLTGIRLKDWERCFISLRKEVGEEKINKILAWYCENIGKEFVPHAYDAVIFRKKFSQIEKCMSMREDSPEEIEEENKNLAYSLCQSLRYPVEVETHLPMIVQKTRWTWKLFHDCMLEYQAVDCEQGDREWHFIESILQNYSRSFTEDWCKYLSTKLGWMENYMGSPHQVAWCPSKEWFRDQFWHKWAQDYCSNGKAFDALLIKLIGRCDYGGRS